MTSRNRTGIFEADPSKPLLGVERTFPQLTVASLRIWAQRLDLTRALRCHQSRKKHPIFSNNPNRIESNLGLGSKKSIKSGFAEIKAEQHLMRFHRYVHICHGRIGRGACKAIIREKHDHVFWHMVLVSYLPHMCLPNNADGSRPGSRKHFEVAFL